jgi:succinate dehydrogenase / fumarate reductase flavoprotein subunit
LGGNSLLDTLVFGARTGKRIAQTIKKEMETFNRTPFQNQYKSSRSSFDEIFTRKGEEPVYRLRDEIKALMTYQVGIFRNESDLLSARKQIRELKERFKRVGLKSKCLAFNHELIQFVELEGMLHLAEVMIEGALARKESRGSHFRMDYPERDDQHWLRHTLAFKAPEGVRLDYKEVTITNYPPKERTY